MTQPRAVIPGSTVMLTRRAERRHHLFRPDPAMNQLFLYALAVCAQRYRVAVHCATLMSTHEHLVVTDRLGTLPQFLAAFHRAVALGTKVLRKWEGAVWDRQQTSVVYLDTPQAIIEKMAYTLVNPTAAGAVAHPEQWPGIRVSVSDEGTRTLRVQKPSFYFDQNNPDWPQEAELRLEVPSLLERVYGEAQVHRLVIREVGRQVQAVHERARARGWRFEGAPKARAVSPSKRATSYEPLRERNPTFAVGRGQRGAWFQAVRRLRAFRQAYREALARWSEGFRDAVFPHGTWMMQRVHGVAVAPAA